MVMYRPQHPHEHQHECSLLLQYKYIIVPSLYLSKRQGFQMWTAHGRLALLLCDL